MKFEAVKDRISFKLINRKINKYPLSGIPHTDFLDLTFIYYIVFNMDETGFDTVLICNSDLYMWNMSVAQLHERACRNFYPLFNLCIYGMDNSEKFLMITTKYKTFGAVFMANSELLLSIANSFGDDLCIIPSSVHEIMVVPAAGIEREKLDESIREVNRELVIEDEFLSDHMYTFSRDAESVLM